MVESRERTSKETVFLCFLIGFCFLWEICKRITFPSSSNILSWVRIAELILLGAVLFRIPYRDHPWYFVLIAGVILIFVTAWIRSPSTLEKTKDYLHKAALVLLLYPSIGILIHGRNLKTLLQAVTAIWTIACVILCFIGIYAVAQRIQVPNYNGKRFIGINVYATFQLWDSNSNTTGVYLAISIITTYIGAAISGKKWISALYLAGAIPMMICLTMTNSRAGIISVMIVSGVAIAVILQKLLEKRIHLKLVRYLVSLFVIVAIAFLGLMGAARLKVLCGDMMRGESILIHSARADEAEEEASKETYEQSPPYVPQKNLFDGYLSGREDIWKSALQALRMRPRLLITGTSVTTVMEDLSKLVPTYDLPQLHNEFLQILVSTGISGALLFIAFLFFVLRAAFRLFSETERPLWERLLFLPFLCLFLIYQVEAIRISSHPDLVGLVMIFTGAAIGISWAGKTKNNPEST